MLKESGSVHKVVTLIALQHHERADGSGYPQRMTRENINELARLVAITDVYDALTTKRVYKDTIPPHKALAMIFENRNQDFDSEMVERFIKTIGIFPIGSYVQLSNGQKAVVVSINHQNTVLPTVELVKSATGSFFKRQMILDLASEEARERRLTIVSILNPEDEGINVEDYLH